MVLKLDVEGAEWGAIEKTSTDVLAKFDQIVVELHDLLSWGKLSYYNEIIKKLI